MSLEEVLNALNSLIKEYGYYARLQIVDKLNGNIIGRFIPPDLILLRSDKLEPKILAHEYGHLVSYMKHPIHEWSHEATEAYAKAFEDMWEAKHLTCVYCKTIIEHDENANEVVCPFCKTIYKLEQVATQSTAQILAISLTPAIASTLLTSIITQSFPSKRDTPEERSRKISNLVASFTASSLIGLIMTLILKS